MAAIRKHGQARSAKSKCPRFQGNPTLADVTRAGVLAAVEEFDRLGRDAFLRLTGFGRARAYYLEHDGRLYDSKAIAGYAHRSVQDSYSGPWISAAATRPSLRGLTALGFTVLNVPNPDWTRDEIILACELVEANGWRQVDAADPGVKALSDLLQSHAIHPAIPVTRTSGTRLVSPSRPTTSLALIPPTVARRVTATI